MTPLVSIIIPTYNRAHLIDETLDSILAQTYTNWECIVIDDGSNDKTEKLLSKYCEKDARFQYHHRPEERPKGANACRNYGFKLSKGEYVNWFDSDDVMHHEKLLIQVKSLENSNYNFSVCQSLIFENSVEHIIGLRCGKIHSNNVFEDYLSQTFTWLTQAPLWKRSFLTQFDYLFDEELQAAQEWEFHCRILINESDYHFTDKPLVYLRRHKDSITYNVEEVNRISQYYLARMKVNYYLKERGLHTKFLGGYFVSFYRKYLLTKDYRMAFNCLTKCILPNKKIRFDFKIKMIVSYFTFLILNKGEAAFKEPKFKNV